MLRDITAINRINNNLNKEKYHEVFNVSFTKFDFHS